MLHSSSTNLYHASILNFLIFETYTFLNLLYVLTYSLTTSARCSRFARNSCFFAAITFFLMLVSCELHHGTVPSAIFLLGVELLQQLSNFSLNTFTAFSVKQTKLDSWRKFVTSNGNSEACSALSSVTETNTQSILAKPPANS